MTTDRGTPEKCGDGSVCRVQPCICPRRTRGETPRVVIYDDPSPSPSPPEGIVEWGERMDAKRRPAPSPDGERQRDEALGASPVVQELVRRDRLGEVEFEAVEGDEALVAPSPDGERERMVEILRGTYMTQQHADFCADALLAAGFGDVTALREKVAALCTAWDDMHRRLAEARQEAERAQDKWQQAEADAATFQDQRDRAREMASREQIERARLGSVVSTLREEMYLSRAEYDLLPPHTQYLLDRQLNRVRSLTATND